MRAILIKGGKGPVENLYLGEAPTPTPGLGQVLVKACILFIITPRCIQMHSDIRCRLRRLALIAWTYHNVKGSIHLLQVRRLF